MIFIMAAATAQGQTLRFNGAGLQPVEVEAPAATGLQALYVVNSTTGLTLSYLPTATGVTVSWQKFSQRGAAYAEEVPAAQVVNTGTESTLTTIEGDCGYVITEGSSQCYVWIVDYAAHPFEISAIEAAPEHDCSQAILNVSGSAPRMTYYSITGRPYEIDRQITLSYSTQRANEEEISFATEETQTQLAYVERQINCDAPLCDTYFRLSGDRFLRAWGQEKEIVSPAYRAQAVRAVTAVEQHTETSDNQIKTTVENLGGSAPCELTFKAAVSDGVAFQQWQFSNDPDFEEITFRSSELEMTYTFTEMGTQYMRFMAANDAGDCEYFSPTYTINIGESQLLCPNAFSPGVTEGVNDQWRVSYKSIVSFECYIFNRWGKKLAEFYDPAKGWDGREGGKTVSPGVYYYVIKARGADGREYNLSGDINVIGYKGL